jgi:hypothetical protein
MIHNIVLIFKRNYTMSASMDAATDAQRPTSDIVKINCPWMIYRMASKLGNICHGWRNFELYRKESIRLNNYINNLLNTNAITDNTILYLAIGAAAEELFTDSTNDKDTEIYNKYEQYRQLLPLYIELAAINHKCPVKIIIISPNSSFENYKDPEFIDATNNIFKWVKASNTNYISELYNITVDIFCTPMMCNDLVENKKIIPIIRQICNAQKINIYEQITNDMEQTVEDVIFINNFYLQLSKLFDNVENKGGVIICNSYAVFHFKSNLQKYSDYFMFPEIKKLFENKYPQRILSEWRYLMEYNKTIMYLPKIPYNKYLSYVHNINNSYNIISTITIIKDNNNKLNACVIDSTKDLVGEINSYIYPNLESFKK